MSRLRCLVASILLVGCASSGAASPSDPETGATTAAPGPRTVVDDRGVEVTIESTERIIPLDGDVAEIVFALGFGDRVVATDLSATYPPEADARPQIGYQRALSSEPILAFEPTLLLATDIAGPPETLNELEGVGVPLVIVPTDPTATGPATKIVAVAEALGVPERGAALAAQVQGEIDAAIATRPEVDDSPTVMALYVRGASTQLVLGPTFASHWLIEAAGGVDAADALGIADSAPITAEALLVAAPDAVLIPASGLDSVGGVEGLVDAVPALAETPAGRRGAILAYDDQWMLGNGPRTGEFLAQFITDLHDLDATAPTTT